MTDHAIVVENLCKRYSLSAAKERHDTLRDQIAAGVKSLFRRARSRSQPVDTFWALKDISFKVGHGEVVGVIGANGAGKSTLLKILSRITEPTSGMAAINGRVASLLEVGTGFQPELSGRDNIFLSGAIMGMRKAEIHRRFDEIVDFSGVEKFIDTPVKRYSSGMYVRLAFAVAAHLEPEIMLVDEVLAVGDANFQKKCLGKMKDVVSTGRTILFVSHNMEAVSTLTQRTVLLEGGRCVAEGPTADVIAEYLRRGQNTDLVYVGPASASEPKITRVEVRTSLPRNVHRNGDPMEVHVEVTTPVAIGRASISFQARNSFHHNVIHLWANDASEFPMCREPGVYRLICQIPKARLYMGTHTLSVILADLVKWTHLHVVDDICPFEVVMYGKYREFPWQPGTCTYLEDCDWQVEKVDTRTEAPHEVAVSD
jgi:lipopolysaccharide transport system ATP-binding protein